MTIYGYCCCSSADQNEARQLFAMSELNIPAERIYTDKVSGKDFERSSFQALLEKVEPGDLIWVLSIDHLGRNYNEILHFWRIIIKGRGDQMIFCK
ncbi:MAG: recombinase family protein [Clostridiales bacterium]|nr:recombinase family protein [Clostridiales bacterium]